MLSYKILIVDDEADIRDTLKELLEEDDYQTTAVATVEEALDLSLEQFDTALVDIKIGKGDGVELLKTFKKSRPILPVIMITGHGSVSLAAEAFKFGAFEFLEKPLRLMQLRTTVRNSVESLKLNSKILNTNNERVVPVYKSKVMALLFKQANRLASLSESVVITGESGAGKELVAQALHFEGGRREKPFVAVNCASLPANLAEDELFGHIKGAFTGADRARKGALERADGGTLFLDEVADLDLTVQAKLLRVLETGVFTPLGGEKEIVVDVRVVTATHKDFSQLVETGEFRHDLWYRLATFILTVPSLSDRVEDIEPLAIMFLDKINGSTGEKKEFDSEAIEFLNKEKFPGNIRELKNVVTRAALLGDGEVIDVSDVELALSGSISANPTTSSNDYTNLDYKSAKYAFELDYFSAIIKKSDGNITAAAAGIRMAQSNLSRKLKELGIR